MTDSLRAIVAKSTPSRDFPDGADSLPLAPKAKKNRKVRPTPKEFLDNVSYTLARQAGWRRTNERHWRFIYNKQWDKADELVLEEENRPAMTTGRGHTAISLIVGQFIANDMKFRYNPSGRNDAELVGSINELRDDVLRRSDYDWGKVLKFVRNLCFGVAVSKVVKNSNPMEGEIAFEYPDPRDWFFDPYARKITLDDAAFQFQFYWLDLDVAKKMYPWAADTLQYCMESRDQAEHRQYAEPPIWELGRDYQEDYKYWMDADWTVNERRQVRICEYWYLQPEKTMIVKFQDGRKYDVRKMEADQVEWLKSAIAEAEAVGLTVQYEEATVNYMRVALFHNKYMIYDGPTPYDDDKYPFAPSFCYLNDEFEPMGVLHAVMDSMKEINKRKSSIMESLVANGVIVEDRAGIKDFQAFARQWSKPNGIVRAANAEGIVPRQYNQNVHLHFEYLRLCVEEVMELTGASRDALGLESDAKSRVAIDARRHQSAQILMSVFEFFRWSLKREGELTLSRMQQYYTYQYEMRVRDKKLGMNSFLVINELGVDEEGNPVVLNDISQAKCDVDVSATANDMSEREAQTQMLRDIARDLQGTPQGMELFIRAIESSDIANRAEIAEVLRGLSMQPSPQPSMLPGAMEAANPGGGMLAAPAAVAQPAPQIPAEDAQMAPPPGVNPQLLAMLEAMGETA